MSSPTDKCWACDMPMRVDENGGANHLDQDGGVNHDQDADHVALSPREMRKQVSALTRGSVPRHCQKVDDLETVIAFSRLQGSLGGATSVRISPRRVLIYLAGENEPVRVTAKQMEDFRREKGLSQVGLNSFEFADLAKQYKKKP